MKRYSKIVKNWFFCLITRKDWKEIIVTAISILLSIAVAIFCYVETDTVPATQLDYEQLEKKAYSLEKNPDLLLKTDCNINVNGKVITVKFENNECILTAEYDRDFNILSTYREDKYMFFLFAIFLCFLVSILAFLFVYLVLFIILFFFEYLVKAILKVIKAHKIKN